MDDAPHRGDTQRFFSYLRNVLCPHANRTCSDYAMILLTKTQVAATGTSEERAALKKMEERRRRRLERECHDASDSDVELDFDRWMKTDRGKRMQMNEAIDRAAVFRNKKHVPLAAIDGAFLDALNDADEPQELSFDVKNRRGDAIFEVKMTLRQKTGV